MQCNNLTVLPDEFGNLSNLLKLHLHYNRMTHLPDSFSRLVLLQSLDLKHNSISVLGVRGGAASIQCKILINCSRRSGTAPR